MSRTIQRLSIAALVLSAGSVCFAQSDLDRILERDKIAAQKLQSEVTLTLAQSRVLERTAAGQAADLLRETMTKIRNATELPADERARLLQRLQIRLREVSAAAQGQSQAAAEAARNAEAKALREARAAAQGTTRPAATSPQGAADVAGSIIEQRNAALASINKNKVERNARNQDVLAGVQRGAVGQTEPLKYSSDWARISERGKTKLSEKEVALLKALNSTMSVNFEKTKLSDAIDLLQEKAGLTILVDETSLKDAAVDLYEEAVTFKVNKVSVRTILRKVLADRNLTYVIKEGMLQVVTPQKAREMMVVRTYPVSDLVADNNPLFWGPIFSRAIMLQNAQRIIDMIQSSVEPSQWNAQGGGATITFHEPTMSLVVRASAEMHYQLGGGVISR